MSVKLIMKNHDRLILAINDIAGSTEKGARQGLYKVGRILKATANKNILEKPKAGKTYFIRRGRSGRRFKHVASAAGESFANKSGAARKTLGFDVRGSSSVEFGFRRNAATDYVSILENEKQLNRPTLKIAIKQNQRNAVKLLEDEIRKAMK